MVNVKVHDDVVQLETPSQQSAQPSAKPGTATVTDSLGRRIAIATLGPVEKMRAFAAVGPENAKNDGYMSIAQLAFLVTEIDGEPIPRPKNVLQLEGLLARLGNEGVDAIIAGAVEHLQAKPINEAAVKNS
jgi:hypothetical protein